MDRGVATIVGAAASLLVPVLGVAATRVQSGRSVLTGADTTGKVGVGSATDPVAFTVFSAVATIGSLIGLAATRNKSPFWQGASVGSGVASIVGTVGLLASNRLGGPAAAAPPASPVVKI